MIQERVQVITIKPPQKPDEVSPLNFAAFEIITQHNVMDILGKIEKGEREPLSHVMIPYEYYLTMAAWNKAVINYIEAAEDYFRVVMEGYNKSLEKDVKVQPD